MSLVLSISAFYQIVYSLIFHDLGPGNGNFLLKNWPYLVHKASNIGILESEKNKTKKPQGYQIVPIYSLLMKKKFKSKVTDQVSKHACWPPTQVV